MPRLSYTHFSKSKYHAHQYLRHFYRAEGTVETKSDEVFEKDGNARGMFGINLAVLRWLCGLKIVQWPDQVSTTDFSHFVNPLDAIMRDKNLIANTLNNNTT